MTTYGTISSGPSETSRLEFISRIKSGLGTQRPWKEMLHCYALSVPSDVSEAVTRVRTNIAYFPMNYVIIVFLILCLGLLGYPKDLIFLMIILLFQFFLRNVPLVLVGRTVDDRVVLIVWSVVMIIALLLIHATVDIIVSLLIGLVIVLVHAVFRKTDDLFLDEEAMGSDGNGLTPPLSAPSSS
ncbi:hypothetical protein NE237_025482 [Protea cynaroides]|uniref:PRA1 family protein n=1 Tax=Protea cynaroides TaxID=273540 RepID=A0A9Q0H1Y8_9MAGN|nr:hypothetical protein NE237_025482 [Protea cynaroides]